jgi:cytochrome c peroxidase
MNSVDRSKSAINQLNGFIGRGIYLAPSGAVLVDVAPRDHNANAQNLKALRRGASGIHVHLAARSVTSLARFDSINLAKHGSAWRMSINKANKFCVSIQPKGRDIQTFCSDETYPISMKSWTVYGFNITPVSKRLRLFVNGETVANFELQGYSELSAEDAPIIIGPAMTDNQSKQAILIADEFGLNLKARSEEFDQATAGFFRPMNSVRASSLEKLLPGTLTKPANGLSIEDLWLPSAAINPIKAGQYQKLVELGESVFMDDQLTGKNISCATCHNPKAQFVDTRKNSNDERLKKSRGVDGKLAERHTPTLLNRGWSTRQMADGSATSLVDQVLMPITNPNEMGGELAKVITYLRSKERYAAEFTSLFNRLPTKDDLAAVLAVYTSSLTSPSAEADAVLGSRVANQEQGRALRILRGQVIFNGKGGCVGCHSGPNFTDESFHNTGLSFGEQNVLLDIGRARFSRSQRDVGAVKTPTLRAIKSTAPYMTHGQFDSLAQVIDFYNRGGRVGPNRSSNMRPLKLSNGEQADLLEYLRSL